MCLLATRFVIIMVVRRRGRSLIVIVVVVVVVVVDRSESAGDGLSARVLSDVARRRSSHRRRLDRRFSSQVLVLLFVFVDCFAN
jgi:hypothetical protein